MEVDSIDTNGLLISASEALIKLLDDEAVQDGLEIDEVSLVYWVDTSLSSEYALEDTAIPAWKFAGNRGCYYVEAFAQEVTQPFFFCHTSCCLQLQLKQQH